MAIQDQIHCNHFNETTTSESTARIPTNLVLTQPPADCIAFPHHLQWTSTNPDQKGEYHSSVSERKVSVNLSLQTFQRRPLTILFINKEALHHGHPTTWHLRVDERLARFEKTKQYFSQNIADWERNTNFLRWSSTWTLARSPRTRSQHSIGPHQFGNDLWETNRVEWANK